MTKRHHYKRAFAFNPGAANAQFMNNQQYAPRPYKPIKASVKNKTVMVFIFVSADLLS